VIQLELELEGVSFRNFAQHSKRCKKNQRTNRQRTTTHQFSSSLKGISPPSERNKKNSANQTLRCLTIQKFNTQIANERILLILPEGVLELSLHGLNVRILDQELGAELAKLGKLNLAGAVFINLLYRIGLK
jgi:hypothetical protein